MGRFIVIIIDSFGVGAMTDVAELRKQDSGANTALHIIQNKPEIELPTLEKLGLMNAIGETYLNHSFSLKYQSNKKGYTIAAQPIFIIATNRGSFEHNINLYL